MRILPVLPVAIPLLTAALLAALTKLISDAVSKWLAFGAVIATGWTLWRLLQASLPQTVVYWFGGWTPAHGLSLGISFAIDPFGAGLALFASVLALAAFLFSAQYFDSVGNHFHALILAFLGSMCGFCLTGDMFNLFVFFELMSAAAFALCGYKTEDPGTLQGSLNFAVTNTIGAYFVLSGIALLYARTAALNMAQMGEALRHHPPDKLVAVAFTFIVCGYLVKAAVVPFHFWLADAHAVAPTPVCVLFSGVMVELGLYAVVRIYWTVFAGTLNPHLPSLRTLFLLLGAATAIGGAIMCYSQRNLKRLLAFSTISHVGLITLGLGLFTVMGMAGSALYVLGHGAVKGCLFLTAGILLHRFGAIDEMDLHGKGKQAKMVGLFYFLAAAGLAAVQPTGLALGEDLLHEASKQSGHSWIPWIFLFAGAITSAAVFRAGGRIFFGWGPSQQDESGSSPKIEEHQETQSGHDSTPLCMLAAAAFLLIVGYGFGFLPQLQNDVLAYASRFQDSAGYAAHVLMNAQQLPGTPGTHPIEPSYGSLYALAAGIAIAGLELFSKPFRHWAELVTEPLSLLHRIHSGHVGDYITFLTFGVAVFGLFCIVALTR